MRCLKKREMSKERSQRAAERLPLPSCTSLTGAVRMDPVDQFHISAELGRTDLSSA
jgi:hypothetical protein